MFHCLALLTVLLILSTPLVTHAQEYSRQIMPGQEQAIQDAKNDAEADVNSLFWFSAGCFGNFLGYLLAQTYHHPVPSVPLLGKSPEYVAFYTDTYIRVRRQRQARHALQGCISGVIAYGCLSIGLSAWAADDFRVSF